MILDLSKGDIEMKKNILVETLKLPNESIYQKAKRRYRTKNDYELVIELEKAIDYYRNIIQNIEEKETYPDNDSLWFKLTQSTNSEELYKFIFYHFPFGEVVNLYSLLSSNFKEKYIDEIHNYKDQRLYDSINKFRRIK